MCRMTASKRIRCCTACCRLRTVLRSAFFRLCEQKLRLRLYFVQPQSEVVHRKRRQKQVYEQLAADQPEKRRSWRRAGSIFFPRRGMRLYTTRQNGRNTTRNAVEKKEVRALPFPARNNEESSISVSLLQAHAPACCSFYVPHDLAQSIRGALLRAMRLFCRPCRRKGYDRHGPDGRFLRGRHAVCTIFDCPSSYACHLLCSPDGVFVLRPIL